MKPFFPAETPAGYSTPARSAPEMAGAVGGHTPLTTRVAIYDSLAAAPRVDDIVGSDAGDLIEQLSTRVYMVVREKGGEAPYTVLREIVENLIHADFREIVVSILDDGRTIRFADQGPGIHDKDKAVLPGFTTADSSMKRFIRGVGSGLPIVKEFLGHSGGDLSLEDNLGQGTVVTLTLAGKPEAPDSTQPPVEASPVFESLPMLTLRQKKVLSLVLEFGEAGPTLVSKELSVGLSTAYRDLAFLEEQGLICSDETGKRVLTELGTSVLDSLFEITRVEVNDEN